MYLFVFVCVYAVSRCALTRRLPPSSPSLAGGAGNRDPLCCFYHPPWQLLGGGLAGRAAGAAGSGWTRWLSQERPAPSPSRVLCCRLCGLCLTSGRAAGRRCFFLRLAPPTSGLARRGRRRGAQLDGSLLSKPRAADFGPGTETAAEGRSAGWGARCLRLSTPTLGLARRRRWRGGLPWPGVCFSFIHSPASRREVQLCSVTGPNTI